MNALLGLGRFGVRQIKVFLTQSQAPKTHSSIFKKNIFLHRSIQTSVQLFAKANKPRVTKEGPGATNVAAKLVVAAESTERASATDPPTEQAVTVGSYRFPVIAGENGSLWYADQLRMWGGEPPFLDRHNALFTLLRHAYKTTSVTGKPVVTVATTSSGFGKTRILVEWIAQIFKHPFIVASFLADKNVLDESETTSVENQIAAALNSDSDPSLQRRANFLLRLFNAGLSGSIITVHALRNRRIFELVNSAEVLSVVQVGEICKAILISGIVSRTPFSEEHIAHFSVPSLADLFLRAAQMQTKWPNFVTKTRPAPLLIINIDEVQDLIHKSTARAHKNLAFEIAHNLLLLLPRDSIIINMVGLRVGDLTTFQDQTQFSLVPYLPMDPLLKRKYLSEVCEKVFHKKLFSAATDSNSNDSFSKALSAQLHELWVTACGIPRTIETLVDMLRQPELHLTALPKLERGDIEKIRREMQDTKNFLSIRALLGTLPEQQWNQLLLDLVFCRPKKPASPIGQSTFEELEASGFFIPFHFTKHPERTLTNDNAERNYTIPFYLYSEEIRAAIPAFQGDYSQEQNPHNIAREPFTIILEKVLKVYGRSIIDEEQTALPRNKERGLVIFKGDPNNNAGTILEEAVAASLWMRYLDATAFDISCAVPISAVWPAINDPELYASWRGVIKLSSRGLVYEKASKSALKQHVDFNNYVEYLAQNHYIAINVPSAQFADVIVPLYDKQGNFMKLLCIQCRNVQEGSTKITPAYVYKQMSYILKDAQSLMMILAPNMDTTLLFSQRAKIASQKRAFERWEKKGSYILSNGEKLLSDWFLRVFADSFLNSDE